MALHTTASLASTLPDVWVEKTFIPALRARLQVVPLGREGTLPERNGKVVRWQYFSTPTADTTAVGEGGNPAADTNFTTTAVTATLQEFGGYSEFTKFLVRTAISGTLEEIIEGLAYKAALSLDTIVMNALVAATPPQVNAGAAMTADAVRQAVATLQNASHATGTPGLPVEKHPKSPGGQFYILVASAEAAYDLIGEGAPTWSQAKNTQIEDNLRTPLQATPASSALYGAIVKISDNVPRNAGVSPDDDLNYMFGADSFGVSSIASNIMDPQVRVTMPEERVDLFLRNKGHASYWLLFATAVIDQTRFLELLSDSTGIG